ncbi:MAG: pitrilysin family protein [Candidatus Eisenbacteria bacterium]|nr:pitrilysin family protein [Candidatus Eisenbacteria bacterium]
MREKRRGDLSCSAASVRAASCIGASLVVLVVSALTPAVSCADDAERFLLPNGLTFIARESDANDIVSLAIFMRMGSAYEPDSEAGYSNLTARLILKGTQSLNAQDIANGIESVGARINAYAGKEVGVISLEATREGFGPAVDILLDVLKDTSFPDEEVAQEKSMVLKEIGARSDRLLATAFDLFYETLFEGHPFHKPALGYAQTISNFDRADATRYYGMFFRPSNMVWAAVGNFDSKELLEKIRKTFLMFGGSLEKPKPIEAKPVELVSAKQSTRVRETKATWFVLGYRAPGLGEKGYGTLKVLDAVLGGSMDSRLSTELRDKRGLAYQVGSTEGGYVSSNFLAAYMGTKGDQFEVAWKGVLNEIDRVKADGVTSEEVERTKSYLQGNYVISLETNFRQAYLMALYESLGLGYKFGDLYIEDIKNTTPELVKDLAVKICGNYCLSAILAKQ